MSDVSFADVVHQSIIFRSDRPADRVVLQLLDTRWLQRLRDISQTANTKLVYMFSEHSRFGHSLGVAYLAKLLLERLERRHPEEVARFGAAVTAAALLHDVGHIAPGSHTAYKTWFPGPPDLHEEIAVRIVRSDQEILSVLRGVSPDLPELVAAILLEEDSVPAWTREIISGGGWNADRGNWCIVDSVMAGVSYGKYNIPALLDSMEITDDGHLALRENRLDAMMHFALSRHAMYRQVYHHRVLLAADAINTAIARRARHLLAQGANARDEMYLDAPMEAILRAGAVTELPLEVLFEMRESWWRYHLLRWRTCNDPILSDLSDRLLHRRLFKMVRIRSTEDPEQLLREASRAVTESGYDPEYYLARVSTVFMHGGELEGTMQVLFDDGGVRAMAEADPLYAALTAPPNKALRTWIVLPAEAKAKLGRTR